MAAPEDLYRQYYGEIVPRSFNGGFVTLSYVVSLIGAASTLELINRRTSPKGKFNHLLLVSSAITMGGIAIWCMHFIGNRAIDLAQGATELQISYSSGFTALSFFVPILVLLGAFVAIGTNNVVSWWRVCVGGVLAGTAICGMHYLANASIENYSCHYNLVNVVGSALIAVAASITALAIFFVFRASWTNSWWKRLAAAVVLAGAVSGMHWCAATGTQYSLLKLNNGDNQLSRNTTVIVVICLSVGACFVMAGLAAYSARVKQRYASKAQQVVLAAAVFDKSGRIMVNPDGLLPSENITDTFLGKNPNDSFGTAHPLFHWMFQASRQWSGISTLLSGMTNHLACLPRSGRDRDSRTGIKLINEHGELIENYDIILRELFCVAALALAGRMKEHLTSVGILWDEILATGASGERPGRELRRRHRQIEKILQHNGTASKNAHPDSGDLEEKGMQKRRYNEYGRGSLMFLVRRLQNDRDIEKLEAAGYRFAELRQVSGIIGSSMQVKTRNIEMKLREMASFTEDEGSKISPGVHLGFFGIRARVGVLGFDILVRRAARNLLPAVQMPIERLEAWHMHVLHQLDRVTVSSVARKLDTMKQLTPREMLFASQLFDALGALRAWIDDPVFDDAVLTSTTVRMPCQGTEGGMADEAATLIAFRLVIPIHIKISSPKCEFIPLNFFKVHQVCSASSQQQGSNFVRSVHRDLAPIIDSVPAKNPASRPGSKRERSGGENRMKGALRRLGHRGRPNTTDSDGNPIPTELKRSLSPVDSNLSSSTLKLWQGRRSSDPPMSPSAGSSLDSSPAYQTDGSREPRTFGGIMVSQEITVDIREAEDAAGSNGPYSRKLTRRQQRGPGRMPSDTALCLEDTATAAEDGGTSAPNVGGGIELKKMGVVSTNVHAGSGGVVSNAEVEKTSDATTFVDELFATCIDYRA